MFSRLRCGRASPLILASPRLLLKAVSPIKVSRMHKPDAFFTDLKVNAHTVAEIVRGRVPAPLQHEKLKSRPDTIFREPHICAGERITLKGATSLNAVRPCPQWPRSAKRSDASYIPHSSTA